MQTLSFQKISLFFLLSITLGIPNTIFASEKDNPKINLVFQNKIIQTISRQDLTNWKEYDPYLKNGSPDYQASLENIYYCPFDNVFCDLTLPSRDNIHRRKFYIRKINQNKIKDFFNSLAQEVNKEPENAKFEIIDGKVSAFKISHNGIKLDIDANTKKIIEIIKHSSEIPTQIELTYKTTKPTISTSDINHMGIEKMIGEGVSDFKGSTRSRIHNIHTAVQHFQGYLIKPGEEFSFIKTLGPVDKEHGYLPELVIKHNVTKPEFGGGICQVSTTTFRAAIYSGLKITERHPHAYPVHYYNPQGMDATVYIPQPDLRFINNTPGYILIQTKFEGTHLIFQFYGQDDGRKVEIKGPFITEKNPDGSMKTYFVQKVYDKNGNLIINDTFRSNYASPNRYPHPGRSNILTHKPKNWSKKQWKNYKQTHDL